MNYKWDKNPSMILMGIIGLKFLLFYYLVDLPFKDYTVVLLSLGYISLFYYACQWSKPYLKGAFFGIHTLFSIIMYLDTMYYSYFHELVSVLQFQQAKQLGAVGESIGMLIHPVYFLIFIDLPFLFYFLFIYKGFLVRSNMKRWIKRSLLFGGTLLALLFIINPVNSQWVNQVRHQEFFTYHFYDLYKSIFHQQDSAEFDIAELMEQETREDSEELPDLFGIAEGRSLIVIQVESLQNFPISRFYEGQELTPNLNKLMQEDTIYFDHYYQQLGKGNTSDAEFASQNSLYPTIYGQAYDLYADHYFYGLPKILKDQGYSATAFHGYKADYWNRGKAYPGQGFDRFISEKDFEVKERIGFGLGDKEFFQQSIPYLKELEDPFYSFMVTLSSHHPYEMEPKYQHINLKQEHVGTLFGNYLEAVRYTDESIGLFIEALKEEGLYEDSLIMIYGDHYGLNSMDEENTKWMTEFLGYPYDFDEMMKIPLIAHIPGAGVQKTIETVGGQIDFMPTVLNLMGIKNPNPLIFGQDLVNAKAGFVASQTYMLQGSFITDDMIFEMSRDGVYEHSRAWSMKNREPVDLDLCRPFYDRAIEEIEKSNYILENDVLKQVLKENKQLEDIEEAEDLEPQKLIAHAGGELDGYTYTNAREALDQSYENGLQFIEVDFEYTTDGEIVLFHSWDGFLTKFFGVEPKQYSLEEFKNFQMINGWHQMTLEDLAQWMREHPTVHIVTDTKGDNVKLLTEINKKYPDIQSQIIPQIYFMDEYIKVKYMGYQDIIYTLYRSPNTNEEVLDFVKHHKLLAVTMTPERAKTELPKQLDEIGVFTYTHTINDEESMKILEEYGIDGFYTDRLTN